MNGGYYADPEPLCQSFNICTGESLFSFLCLNGTLFQQQYVLCDGLLYIAQLYFLNTKLEAARKAASFSTA